MTMLKRLGTRVVLPLIFAFVILLMVVAIPFNPTEYSDTKKEESKTETIKKDAEKQGKTEFRKS